MIKEFKKINQIAVLANSIRFKILLALYISECYEKNEDQRDV
jgi:hypothetical protein